MAFNSLFSWIIRQRMYQIELTRRMPVEMQRGVFGQLIKEGSRTAFGAEYDFKNIRNLREFQRHVPIQTYDEFKPWIQRARSGENSVLWPGRTEWFAKSSGTSSDRSKYLPLTQDALSECHYKGGKDLLALFCNQRLDSRLYDGKHLALGGSSEVHDDGLGGFSGDLSAIIVRNLPFWVEARRTPSRSIALMTDWEEKVEAIALATMRQDVRILSGVPSWMMVVAKRVLVLSGASTLGEVWPNLQLFMHGGVSFTPYRAEFESLIGKGMRHEMTYLETYNASEGFFGFQDRLNADDMLLLLDYGIYFEFIPMSEWGSEHPVVLELRELEVDQEYALVISTNAGLWRYALGDVICITELHPFRMQVSGRIDAFLNAFGEELMVHQAEKAMAEACTLTGAVLREFTAAPIFMSANDTGCHEWLVEFERLPEGGLEGFSAIVDASLQRQNTDYQAKRTGGLALSDPLMRVMSKGTFDAWLRSKGKQGGQHKVPRLSNRRDVLGELIEQSLVLAEGSQLMMEL